MSIDLRVCVFRLYFTQKCKRSSKVAEEREKTVIKLTFEITSIGDDNSAGCLQLFERVSHFEIGLIGN